MVCLSLSERLRLEKVASSLLFRCVRHSNELTQPCCL
jgi:hypothetical protein